MGDWGFELTCNSTDRRDSSGGFSEIMMNGDFISSASAALAAELDRMRAAAFRKYREILDAPEDLADSKTLTALRNAATALGTSASDVEADGRVLKRVRWLQARIAAERSVVDMMAAQAEVDAHNAETGQILEQRRREYAQLYDAYRKISDGRVAAQIASRELEKLVAQYSELLKEERLGAAGSL
jgi:hypothetical protein